MSQIEKKARREDNGMRKLSRLEEAIVESGNAVVGKPLVVSVGDKKIKWKWKVWITTYNYIQVEA